MANFEEAIQTILMHEGGYSNHPADSGGETNFGLTLTILKENGFTGDITLLSIDEAKDFYRKIWWEKYKFGLIENQKVATKIFDLFVNFGPYYQTKMIQMTCNEYDHKLKEDGKFGKKTLAAVNKINQDIMLISLCLQARIRYEYLCEKYPKNIVFLSGWLKRARWK